jgi:GTP-binding protein Era
MVSVTKAFKSGYVSVAGCPNVGKSTLLNNLIGSKLAIVSSHPQTTRSIIRGILTTKEAQIIFLDTPGIHNPRDSLGDYMVRTAKRTFQEVNIIYLLVETRPPAEQEVRLIQHAKEFEKQVFLLINKIDIVRKNAILPVIDAYQRLMEFTDIIPVSALKGDNLDTLLAMTIKYLPEGPHYFPEDITSDQIQREFISEFIREKIYSTTYEEVPYSSIVVIEDMQERQGGGAYIQATIYIEKESQKGIIIGKHGKMIKRIGSMARKEIETFLGYSVFLDLRVKVEKEWRRDSKSLRKFGYY